MLYYYFLILQFCFLCVSLSRFVMLYCYFIRYNVVLCLVMLLCNDATLSCLLQYYVVFYQVILQSHNIVLFLTMLICNVIMMFCMLKVVLCFVILLCNDITLICMLWRCFFSYSVVLSPLWRLGHWSSVANDDTSPMWTLVQRFPTRDRPW